eukprot:1154291-Pelagomonas_calceolata.AAC.19
MSGGAARQLECCSSCSPLQLLAMVAMALPDTPSATPNAKEAAAIWASKAVAAEGGLVGDDWRIDTSLTSA